MLSKGWRCLECTVCEACGQATDPGRLLLCDDCDISYHTYCLDPPLQNVPKDSWKCKWWATDTCLSTRKLFSAHDSSLCQFFMLLTHYNLSFLLNSLVLWLLNHHQHQKHLGQCNLDWENIELHLLLTSFTLFCCIVQMEVASLTELSYESIIMSFSAFLCFFNQSCSFCF